MIIFSLILASIYYIKFAKKAIVTPEPLTPKVEIIERKVENFAKKSYFLAKLHSNKSIIIISETDGTIKNKEFQIGDFVEVKITDCTSATLIGEALKLSKKV